jgi:hypothetical protein
VTSSSSFPIFFPFGYLAHRRQRVYNTAHLCTACGRYREGSSQGGVAGAALLAALSGFNSPAANMFNSILGDVSTRRTEAQAAAAAGTMPAPTSNDSPYSLTELLASAAGSGSGSGTATTPSSTSATTPVNTTAAFDAVRDAAASRAREILLNGTNDQRETLAEALAAVTGGTEGNVTAEQVAVALAQLESANMTADELSAALGSALEVGLYKLNSVDPQLERRLVSTLEPMK